MRGLGVSHRPRVRRCRRNAMRTIGLASPSHYSHLVECPICGKDVHKVLIAEHVEVCLTKGRGEDSKQAGPGVGAGGSSRAPDVAATLFGDKTRTGDVPRASVSAAGTASKTGGGFSSASAFARHLGIPAVAPGDDVDRRASGAAATTTGASSSQQRHVQRLSYQPRSPFADLRDAVNVPSKPAGAPRTGKPRAVGPLSGWATPLPRVPDAKTGTEIEAQPTHTPKRPRDGDGDGVGSRDGDGSGDGDGGGDGDDPGCARKRGKATKGADADERAEDDADDPESESRAAEAVEVLDDGGLLHFPLRVMSGNHAECGICLQPFDGANERHVLWPCQHARQCGECAIRIWQTPKAKRRCPWCKSKIDIRPRPFKPFL